MIPPEIPELETSRLRLRQWRDADRAPFAAMVADAEVMRYFPSTMSRAESDHFVDRVLAGFARRGFGWWAVEIPGRATFVGFIGLSIPSFDAHFTPCVEVGWRLAREHWGLGYATEGARACLDLGFDVLGLTEIVALTAHDNLRSRRVMAKLGMLHDPSDDFEHPGIPIGHPLRPQVLYRRHR
ncbi:MAG: GNAT family N-acetyltransferase [Acidobacteriota bacterium]